MSRRGLGGGTVLALDLADQVVSRGGGQGQKDFAIILAKIRDTAIFNRLYIKLYIKFVANNGKNRDSVHAAISFCPWGGGGGTVLALDLADQVVSRGGLGGGGCPDTGPG